VRITDVVTYPIKGAVFVEVRTDAGISGWAEAAPDNRHAARSLIENGLKEWVIGESAFDSARLWQLMFYKNHDLGPGGLLTNAISGIDLALWDLKGRVLGQPVHRLLGGAFRDRVMVYGSFGIGNEKKMTPDEAAAQAAKFVSMGFKAVKVRLQIRELNLDPWPDYTLSYVAAVRKAIGPDIGLLVDINNGYTANRAVQIGKKLQDEYGVWFMEDPVSDQTDRELWQIAEQVDIPLIAGEKEYTLWQFRDLIVNGNPDVINPDILKCGGMTPMRKIAVLAEAWQKQIIPHNTRPTLGTAASLQFLASIPNAGPVMEYPDIDHFSEMVSLFPGGFLQFEDGFMTVPQVPGMGLTPDPELVRRAVQS
jgi:L-alanine-DL-glutamate epimerase-like enolase superfamily enzyme